MRILAFTAFFFAVAVQAASTHPLLNDREGKSYILGSRTSRSLERLGTPRESLEKSYRDVVTSLKGEACAFKLNEAWLSKLSEFPEYKNDKELFLKALRHQGLIDDVILQQLLKAYWVQKDVDPRADDTLIEAPAEVPAEMRPFRDFSLKRSRGKCLHENFRELMSAFRQSDKEFTTKKLKRKMDAALTEGYLTEKAASELWEAMDDGIESWTLSLADYVTKRQFLRNQFPLPLPDERADFVTKQTGKSKESHRQKLYSQYTPVQITLMGNIIKKLKERLESPRIEIIVYDDEDAVREVLSLDPMERFRFAIRVLRKEMKLLSINNYFLGRQPSYTDLMAAAYEMGVVTALEIDQVAKLEEIWNPKKTFWDKAAVWVRMFGSVLSVVVPPPYGFIPALAITAIEAVTRDQPDDTQDSLF